MTNEEAIKAIKANYPSGGYERLCEALDMAIKALEERKTGKWIKHENKGLGKCMLISWECSACKTWMGCEHFVRRSYCPNCGAKMEGAEE